VLSAGWQERLVPLTDEAGIVRAYCLEVHDNCISKLMAGREKDFAFIKELLDRGPVNINTLIARAELIADMPQGDALSYGSKGWRLTSSRRGPAMTCEPFSRC
jgi:hypothetical protein